jgi:hypothetical protein
MLYKKIFVGLALALFLATMASSALAGTTTFNVIVPKIGGKANTSITTKSTNTNGWSFYYLAVGNNKTVNFRSMKNNSAIGNWYSGTTGSTVWGPYTSTQSIGAIIYGQIGTNWNEPVNVQVSGTFNSY